MVPKVLHKAFDVIFSARFLKNKKNVEQNKKHVKKRKNVARIKNVKKRFLHLCIAVMRRSAALCQVFSSVVLWCEAFMVPVVLLLVFLATFFIQRLQRDLQGTAVNSDNDAEVYRRINYNVEIQDDKRRQNHFRKCCTECFFWFYEGRSINKFTKWRHSINS